MKKLHYFPFYYLDWLSSSSVVMMTHEEKGLFIDMLARCYNDDGLPDDDSKLQRLFNCDLTVLDSVKKMFFSVDGLLKNKKLEKIKNDQQGLQRGKSKAGKASAKARAERKLQKSTAVQHVLNSVETKPQQNPTNKTKQNKTEQSKYKEEKEIFDIFRKSYEGTKGGLDKEFDNFIKKHKDWKEVLPDLKALLDCQKNQREALRLAGEFVPAWKNLSTWINQRCWGDEYPKPATNPRRSYSNVTTTPPSDIKPDEEF